MNRFSFLPLFLSGTAALAAPSTPALAPTVAVFNAPQAAMIYHLAPGQETWPAEKTARVVESMNGALALYNAMGDFPKSVTASYNAGTPTADGSYNGNIRFGGSINKRVALHELGHVLGIGTYGAWNGLVKDGLWTGAYAQAQLRAFDGPDAILHADRQHFWPYGLNFDKESSPENDRRHVLMVAAFRRDMGIAAGMPIRGLVGVGTYQTQAEFRNLSVVKNSPNTDESLLTTAKSSDLKNWKIASGEWQSIDGALRQTADAQGAKLLVGEPWWSDYTLSLQARKLSGNEGFQITFGASNADAKSQWNIGGWGNTGSKIETLGAASEQIPAHIEVGRWYDVRVEVRGTTAKCYLDGQLIQQITQ